jgi:hypothetical protein
MQTLERAPLLGAGHGVDHIRDPLLNSLGFTGE